MNTSHDNVLEINGLSVRFGDLKAVKDVSFGVKAGQTLAIVGESGSGKSTTAMAIMRLLSDTTSVAGNLWLRRADRMVDLQSLSEVEMRQVRGSEIAMIFQEPMTSLNPVMTVGAQISEAVQLHQDVSHEEASSIALESLRRVRLPDPEQKVKQYPHQLSGGMRQRVMIAMALACRPAVLIADEPTTALDVTIQAEVLHLIRNLQEETGMAIIYITHDLGVVAHVADEVLVMHHGSQVEQGPVNQFFASPQEDYTKKLLASVPVLGGSDRDLPTKFDLEQPTKTNDAEISLKSKPHSTAPADRQIVLDVRNLSKSFVVEKTTLLGRPRLMLQAVQDVSLSLAKGETLSIVGESGSGKSTLARAILQLVRPDSGSVLLNGKQLVGLTGPKLRAHRSDLQMVFQDPYASLNPKFTIGDLIAEPTIIHHQITQSDRKEIVKGLLRQVGLPETFLKRRPSELSGGQRQRVSIARALSTQPSIIVLDEAVSALDVTVQAQITNLLIDLQRQHGLSYIFISHDMGIVDRISHRVAVMQKGRIVEIGSKRDVLDSPTHPYTQHLLSAVLRPDPKDRNNGDRAPIARPMHSMLRHPNTVEPPLTYHQINEDHLILHGQEEPCKQAHAG